jgi:1-acyl-sn-glycerol-3-phosphate acyltransferase
VPSQVKTKFLSYLWMFYFLFSIGLIGSVLAFGVAVPLYLVGLPRLADRVMCFGIQFLLFVQPWLHARVRFSKRVFTKPEAPGRLYVSNHRSHLDVFFLLAYLPRIRIVAKESLFRIPFLNFMMRILKQIPMESGRIDGYLTTLKIVEERLAKGESVHIFAETTRCVAGLKGVQPFLLAPFQSAIRAKTLVIPIVFKDTDSAWPKGFFGLSLHHHILVEELPAIRAESFQAASELRDLVVKQIEEALAS